MMGIRQRGESNQEANQVRNTRRVPIRKNLNNSFRRYFDDKIRLPHRFPSLRTQPEGTGNRRLDSMK